MIERMFYKIYAIVALIVIGMVLYSCIIHVPEAKAVSLERSFYHDQDQEILTQDVELFPLLHYPFSKVYLDAELKPETSRVVLSNQVLRVRDPRSRKPLSMPMVAQKQFKMTIPYLVSLGLGLKATTYGYGEGNCGDVGKPRKCTQGAITSSGMVFDPNAPTAALTAPFSTRFKPFWIRIRAQEGGHGHCTWILINDKKNPRYLGHRMGGLDMSPGALRALGIVPKGTWTGYLRECW